MPDFLTNVLLIICQELHFVYDGTTTHLSLIAHWYLNQKFPSKWIGRGGSVAWPPHSPDLNSLDFYLWGHLKWLVYSSPGVDMKTLKLNCDRFSDDMQYARNLRCLQVAMKC
jgi:hypothetical protein